MRRGRRARGSRSIGIGTETDGGVSPEGIYRASHATDVRREIVPYEPFSIVIPLKDTEESAPQQGLLFANNSLPIYRAGYRDDDFPHY
jgi:hypothetical protein